MLPVKRATLFAKILALFWAASLSFFVLSAALPKSTFIENALESVEANNNTVMSFSAATLSTSLAISALPDDFASPLAEVLADMNIFFVAILAILFFEKILVLFGVKVAFSFVIPAACLIGIIAIVTKKPSLKPLSIRLCALGLSLALVVPLSTLITKYVAADLTAYVNETIHETEAGADKLNEAMESDDESKTIFEKLSALFHTAINGVTDLMSHFQNTIRKCMNSIAILILTNFLMPLLTFFFLKWIVKEIFGFVMPVPSMRWQQVENMADNFKDKANRKELLTVGGGKHEE